MFDVGIAAIGSLIGGKLKKQQKELNTAPDTTHTDMASNMKNVATNLGQDPQLDACLLATEGLIHVANVTAHFLRPDLRLRYKKGSVREVKFFSQAI